MFVIIILKDAWLGKAEKYKSHCSSPVIDLRTCFLPLFLWPRSLKVVLLLRDSVPSPGLSVALPRVPEFFHSHSRLSGAGLRPFQQLCISPDRKLLEGSNSHFPFPLIVSSPSDRCAPCSFPPPPQHTVGAFSLGSFRVVWDRNGSWKLLSACLWDAETLALALAWQSFSLLTLVMSRLPWLFLGSVTGCFEFQCSDCRMVVDSTRLLWATSYICLSLKVSSCL